MYQSTKNSKRITNAVSSGRIWHLIDARGETVGRLSTRIAKILTGKNKPIYDPSTDCGDNVLVINARFVYFSGEKWKKKLYRWHTGYPGGLKERKAHLQFERDPPSILYKAIYGMLPKNSFRSYIDDKLTILADDNIPEHIKVNKSVIKAKPPVDRIRLPLGGYRTIIAPPELVKKIKDFTELPYDVQKELISKGEAPEMDEQYFYKVPEDKTGIVFADTFEEFRKIYNARQSRWHANLERKRRIYEGDAVVDEEKNFPIYQQILKKAREPIAALKPNPNKAAPATDNKAIPPNKAAPASTGDNKKIEQKPSGDKKPAEKSKK